MKTLKISAVLLLLLVAGFFILREYNFRNTSPEAQLLHRAGPNIEAYMKQDMHDPQSLSVEYTSTPLLLDTIQQDEVFRHFRESYLIRANCRGNNPLGASVLSTHVFFVSEEGRCLYSQSYEELSPEEQEWISEASIAALTTGT